MKPIGQYVVSVSIAALLCGILKAICGKGFFQPIINLLCGIYIVTSLLSPLGNLAFDIPFSFPSTDTEAAQAGQDYAGEYMRQIIIDQTREYILEKASSMGVSIQAEVELGEGTYPIPQSLTVTGDVPAHIREKLSDALEMELGIRKEDQMWIG